MSVFQFFLNTSTLTNFMVVDMPFCLCNIGFLSHPFFARALIFFPSLF